MTRSRIEQVQPDAATAARLVDQAGRHLASAHAQGVDPESAYGLCYQAVLKALVATLAVSGKRASSGAGSHVVLLQEAGRQLTIDTALADRVDHMRRSRHGVFYEGEEISRAELRSALADAATIVGLVKKAI